MGNYATNKFPTDRWASSDSLNNLPECIASIDAAIRNLFGVNTSTLSQIIRVSGTSVLFQGTFGFDYEGAVAVDDIVETIELTPQAGDNTALASVTAIRNLVSAMIAAI